MVVAEAYKSAAIPVDQQRFGLLVNDLAPNHVRVSYAIQQAEFKGIRPFDIVTASIQHRRREGILRHGLELFRFSPVNSHPVLFEAIDLDLPESLVEAGAYTYQSATGKLTKNFNNPEYVRQVAAVVSAFRNHKQLIEVSSNGVD